MYRNVACLVVLSSLACHSASVVGETSAVEERHSVAAGTGLEREYPLSFVVDAASPVVAIVPKNGASVRVGYPGRPDEYCCGSYGQSIRGAPNIASCSGFAVAEDLVFTAAHCIRAWRGAENLCVVAGYQNHALDDETYPGLGRRGTCAQLRGCVGRDCPEVRFPRVVAAGTGESGTANDWVLLRLDKRMRKVGVITPGTLVALGDSSPFRTLEAHPGGVPLMASTLHVCASSVRTGLLYSIASAVSRSSGGLLRGEDGYIGMHVGRTKRRSGHASAPLCRDGFPDDVACESTCDRHPCGLKVAVSGRVLAAAYRQAIERKNVWMSEGPEFFRYDGKGLVVADPVCLLDGSSHGKECDPPPGS